MNVNLFPALPNFNIAEIYPDAIYRNREFFTGIGNRKINDVDCHETKGQFEYSLNTLLNEFKKAVPELNRSGFGRDIRVVKFFGMLMNSRPREAAAKYGTNDALYSRYKFRTEMENWQSIVTLKGKRNVP